MRIARPQSFSPPSLRERRAQQSFPFIRRQCAKLSSWTARWLAVRRRVSLARCICSAVLGRETWKFIPGEIRAFEFLAGWRAELSFLRWQRNAAYLARLIVYKKTILLESISLPSPRVKRGQKGHWRSENSFVPLCVALHPLLHARSDWSIYISLSLSLFLFPPSRLFRVEHVQMDGEQFVTDLICG